MLHAETVVAPEPIEGAVAQALLVKYTQEMYARWGGPIPEGGAGPETANADLVPPRGRFLIARVDGRPAGCIGLRQLDDSTGEIKRMFVHPLFRGRGLARRLLTEVEIAASQRGLTRLRLDTMASLVEARALYTSAGYRDISAYNRNIYAQHWMEKEVASDVEAGPS